MPMAGKRGITRLSFRRVSCTLISFTFARDRRELAICRNLFVQCVKIREPSILRQRYFTFNTGDE